MPYTPMTLYDPARIPNTNDEVNFHADATYVWETMAAQTIPEMNANLSWINAALTGSETVVDTVSGLVDGSTKAGDADKLDGNHASYFQQRLSALGWSSVNMPMLARNETSNDIPVGQVVPGSSLRASNIDRFGAAQLSGSYRCLGFCGANDSPGNVTLFLKVA